MNKQNHFKIPEFQPNIPLLEIEFDTRSQELEDFIFDHAQTPDEDWSIMVFRAAGR